MSHRLSPLIATSLVGAGSLAMLALSVLSMKIYAVLVGPAGIGVFALLQSVLNIAILVMSLGLQASAITTVSAADRHAGRDRAAIVAGAAIMVSLVAGGAGAALLLVLREPIAIAMLGGADRAGAVTLLAPALFLSVTATVNSAVLAGFHRLRAATIVNLVAAALGAAVTIGLVATIREDGFAPGLAVFALFQFVLSAYVVARLGVRLPRGRWGDQLPVVRELLSLGLPVAASQAVTTGTLFVLPVLVLHALGPTEVGLYRAAAAVSVGLTTFFLAGIHQDFLPRMAAAEEGAERVQLVERRMRLVIGIGLPPILALLAMGPVLLDVLYSAEFRASLPILQWQLVGDLIRIPTIVLTVAALAVRSRLTYFGLEATGGTLLIGGTVAGIAVFGLAGPGVGYALSSFVTFAVAWLVLSRNMTIRPGRLQALVMATVAGAATILIADLGPVVRGAVFGSAAFAAAAIMWPRLLRLHREAEL